ncbi:histidine triad nucleotide-binding protein 3 [Callorhinchus milii]|uniref:Adenosine 5'-monophosphoramidase HINT3 n=1 Tax=Callorhinchus milii TaxID=7868 RepID=A0A4W3IDD5_CALMI|nr:histidine triad nucleotide-binding protein 3 [Callorhinchus milii]|eukprot:gi/632962771/ref/XP_007897505.1/ PREDICTED: histidine triad nucleotide-binding protein 3 [Callorhinchus milii]
MATDGVQVLEAEAGAAGPGCEAGAAGPGCEAGAAGLGCGEPGAGREAKAPSEAVSAEDSGLDHKCLFCKIGNEKEAVELLHLDDQFACFKDVRPGAPHHYLVVPRNHIGNCKTLKKEHVSTVEKMVEVGKSVLQQKGFSDLADVRLGFHWPPFCSMAHLHLHVLAPASRMGFLSRMVYKSNSYWFITVDQLIERLKSLPGDSKS